MKKIIFLVLISSAQIGLARRFMPLKEYIRPELTPTSLSSNPSQFKSDVAIRENISAFFQNKYNDRDLFDVKNMTSYFHFNSTCGVYYAASSALFSGAKAYSMGCKSGECEYYFFKAKDKNLEMIYHNKFLKLVSNRIESEYYKSISQVIPQDPKNIKPEKIVHKKSEKHPLVNFDACLTVMFEKYNGNKVRSGALIFDTKKITFKYDN